jgi:azurin
MFGEPNEIIMKRTFVVLALTVSFVADRAWPQDCAVVVEANDQIQYLQSELSVSAGCPEITVTLRHVGKLAANLMGHNWVLTKTEDYMAVAQAGQAAGPPNFVPADDPRVVASTPIIGGGQEVTIAFDASRLERQGDYTFFCSFPGHFVLMYGKFMVE